MTRNDKSDASDAEPERDADDGEDIDSMPDAWEQANSGTPADADEWVQVAQLEYDRECKEELATALVKAIAKAKGVDPLDHAQMPPLYESVDAHALEETFFGPYDADKSREEGGRITFRYNTCSIVLRSDGWIFVYEPT